jgi:carbon-monoxide dehydrogenase medium subunit
MKLRLAQPSMLVDISRLAELKQLSVNGGATIGAGVVYDDLLKNSALKESHAALYEAVAKVGDVQVRNRGTVGGAAAHADPASDVPAALLALGATFTVVGPGGSRTVAADDFFVDILTTALEADEVLTSISVPRSGASAYEKFAHPASGYAVCGVAVNVTRDGSGKCSDARIAVGGATYTATRCTAAEQALVGSNCDAAAIEAAAAKAADGLDLAGDHYASAEYRGHLVKVFTKRALTRACGA